MERSMRRAALVAFIAIVLCLGGCEFRSLKIRIPDFDSNQVGGLWIYPFSENSEEFVKLVQLFFTEPFDQEGTEVLGYSFDGFVDVDGNQIHMETQVVRNPENPDEVTLELWFPCAPPGAVKVSTYNAIGESLLSDETLYF
jgi:hypothetical protein